MHIQQECVDLPISSFQLFSVEFKIEPLVENEQSNLPILTFQNLANMFANIFANTIAQHFTPCDYNST